MQRIKCLAQGHNAVPPVRLEPTIPFFRHCTPDDFSRQNVCIFSGGENLKYLYTKEEMSK